MKLKEFASKHRGILICYIVGIAISYWLFKDIIWEDGIVRGIFELVGTFALFPLMLAGCFWLMFSFAVWFYLWVKKIYRYIQFAKQSEVNETEDWIRFQKRKL